MGQVQPMLATAVTSLPDGAGWAYEFKWDGIRALLDVSEQGVTLRSRNGNDITAAFPEVTALTDGIDDALFDGELVCFVNGRPSFSALQRRTSEGGAAPATFVLFDVLRRYGVDLTARAYVERRAMLDRWAAEHPEWTLSPYFDDGAATEAAAREHGLEGVVAKRLASTYRSGVRSGDWQKLRFVRTGDFVIVGWEASDESPRALSSLLLARANGDGFVFSGKVGSGLDERALGALTPLLQERDDAVPMDTVPQRARGRRMHWVEPEVVVEVRFSEWTPDGRLRHPVFVRLREDKNPEDTELDTVPTGRAHGASEVSDE